MLLAQVGKSHQGRRLVDVTRRVVCGPAEAVADAIARTKGCTPINTSSIERLNATFRASLAPLTRRGRRLAHGTALLGALARGLDGAPHLAPGVTAAPDAPGLG